MNYYNEFDPYAAQWLRNLIEAGHIPKGEVDSRSIKDVKASELVKYTQCHFFAGLGGWSHALRLAGWPEDRPVWTGSCPCQPFSAAGAGGGVTDERHLWPVWFNLIRECRPDVIFGEQVEAAINHGWLDLVQADLEGEGYACGAVGIPAGGVGAPHIRQRLWFVADAASKRGNERFELESYGRTGETKQDGLGSKFDQLANTQFGRVSGRDQRRFNSGGQQMAQQENGPRVANESGYRCEDAANQLGNTPSAGRRTGGGDGRGDETSDGRDTAQRGTSGAEAERTGVVDGQLADDDERLQRPIGGGAAGTQRQPSGHVSQCGFWDDCDWLPCRDGRSRPVEPGTFPLAYGLSGRVGRLRAYGNAIVPQVAQTFIEAYLES